MRPRVVLHNAVSLDGRIDGFEVDLAAFYGLVQTWNEDVTLAGSDTILASPEGSKTEADEPVAPPEAGRTLLAVVDGKGRVASWRALREAGLWGGVLSIGCATTPRAHVETLAKRGVEHVSFGRERVDLAAALDALGSRGARVVRIESGGTLGAALLRAGLVDELSLLVHPVVVGGEARSLWRALEGGAALRLRLAQGKDVGEGKLWLRYDVC